MNPKITIGLLVVLGVVAAAVMLTDSKGSSTSPPTFPGGGSAAKEKEDPNLQMFSIDDKEIVRIEYLRGGSTTAIVKDGDEWRLQPSGELAERFRVNSLLVRITSLKANRRIENPGDNMAVYGLQSPEMLARLWRSDDSLYELIVGGKTPNDAGTYAKRPDTPYVYVIPNTLANDIERMVTEPPVVPPTPTPRPTDPVTPTPIPTATLAP